MKKAWSPEGTDWLDVVIPPLEGEDKEQYTITINLSFMLSSWECIFGRGCPGLFGAQESQINPDIGCCKGSFWFDSKLDHDNIKRRIEDLTDDDWDTELRAYVEKNGWANIYRDNPPPEGDDEPDFNGKGKVYDGACVFANRSTGNVGSTGKIGCAFHHMGARTGVPDHVDIMPKVCWQLPLRLRYDDESDNITLTAWSADEWDPEGGEWEEMRYHCNWWCIDSPEAYVGESTVWKTMEREIRASIGDREYDLIEAAIVPRLGNYVAPMPGSALNDGRPLLPLLVGDRTPRRPEPNFERQLTRWKMDS